MLADKLVRFSRLNPLRVQRKRWEVRYGKIWLRYHPPAHLQLRLQELGRYITGYRSERDR